MTHRMFEWYEKFLEEKIKKSKKLKLHVAIAYFKNDSIFSARVGYFEDIFEANVFIDGFRDCYESLDIPYITSIDGVEKDTNIMYLQDYRK